MKIINKILLSSTMLLSSVSGFAATTLHATNIDFSNGRSQKVRLVLAVGQWKSNHCKIILAKDLGTTELPGVGAAWRLMSNMPMLTDENNISCVLEQYQPHLGDTKSIIYRLIKSNGHYVSSYPDTSSITLGN